jgi:hypothetical protein
VSATSNSTTCDMCAAGTIAATSGLAECTACPSGQWAATTGSSECTVVQCPTRASVTTTATASTCTCDDGYLGSLVFDATDGSWSGICELQDQRWCTTLPSVVPQSSCDSVCPPGSASCVWWNPTVGTGYPFSACKPCPKACYGSPSRSLALLDCTALCVA